ncbi:unnamed protein product [Symbiodinium sp. CCMP2456]|nr:unnamed protein product [Symbiodinium sp. CCMP2456]
MARPPESSFPTGSEGSALRPHQLSPDQLTTFVGTCLPSDSAAPVDRSRCLRISGTPVPWPPPPVPDTPDSDWLGVYLYTPHYPPMAFALQPRERTSRSVEDLILSTAPGAPSGLFDAIVALRPQRFPDYASYIRFPSIIGRLGDEGFAAVVCDLSRVGGRCFATTLPCNLSVEALEAFIIPLTQHDERSLQFFVGVASGSWSPRDLVRLVHGDVVTVIFESCDPDPGYCIETLFLPDTGWGPLHHCFPPELHAATCVHFQDQRYTFQEHFYFGQTIVQYIAERFRLAPDAMATCSFPIGNLDVQGAHCAFLVAVKDLPPTNVSDDSRPAACGFFVLLDLRPLGYRPRTVYSSQSALHLPTLISDIDLTVPPDVRVGVKGGRMSGDHVFFERNCTLLFFAEVSPVATEVGHTSRVDADLRGLTLPAALPSPDGLLPPRVGGAAIPSELAPVSGSGSATATAVPPPEVPGFTLQTYVYTPDILPELVPVCVALPLSVGSLTSAVQAERLPEARQGFPVLIPVSPQPMAGQAFYVAEPRWLVDGVVVMLDCRRLDGSTFAALVAHSLSRESLLLAAGQPADSNAHVHVHGLLRPLGLQQRITLVSGMCISFVPRGEGAPAGHDLSAQLMSCEGWEATALPLGPRLYPGSHMRVLTDAWPFNFEVKPGRRASFKSDVAVILGAPEFRLSFKSARPRIVDGFFFGVWTSDVLVVTEQLSRIPFPPARCPDPRLVLILDCRRILKGIVWQLCSDSLVAVQPLSARFQHACPPRHSVSITGAPVVSGADGVFFEIVSSQVLIVEFVEETADVDLPPHQPPPFDGGPSRGGDPGPDHPPGRPNSGSGPTASAESPSLAVTRIRSRSPRAVGGDRAGAVFCALTNQVSAIRSYQARSGREIMWGPVPLLDAIADGARALTPVLPDRWRTSCFLAGFQVADALPSLSACRPASLGCQTWFFGVGVLLLALPVADAGPPFVDDSLAAYRSVRLPLVAVTPALFSAALRLLSAFGRFCEVVLHYWLLPVCCRFLQEPLGRTPGEQRHIDQLRSITQLLGGPWMPSLPNVMFDHVLDLDTASADPSEDSGEFRLVSCAVLKHDYAVELFTVAIRIPAVQGELEEALQQARNPTARHLFPSLLPAIPQPHTGTATFVAAPRWCPFHHGVVFDTSRFDDRIFVAFTPAYASRGVLLRIADLPVHLGVEVWVGLADEPLRDGLEIHLFPGAVVWFLPDGEFPPFTYTLGEALQVFGIWSSESTLPVAHFESAYCLAYQGQGQLLVLAPQEATRYRERIAAVTGAPVARMRLYASQPPPADASLNGVVCRSVVAVGVVSFVAQSRDWHLILLDCRPIEDGWRTYHAYAGIVDVDRLLDEIGSEAPLGWHAHLLGDLPQTGELTTVPGQVIVVGYAPDSSGTPSAPFVPSRAAGSSAPDARPTGDEVPYSAWDDDDFDDPAVHGPLASGSADGTDTIELHFLVLVPEYGAEHVCVPTHLPTSAGPITGLISEARDVNCSRMFPWLMLPAVQPSLSFACALALPPWEFPGVPVLVVCFVPPFRIFAAILPAVLTVDAILHFSGIGEGVAVQVFVADVPWAAPPDAQIHVNPGDLLTISPTGTAGAPPLQLQVMLSSGVGWHTDPILPGPYDEGVWLLTDQRHQRLVPRWRPPLRALAANILRIPERELMLMPATPAIRDHASRGFPSRQVFLAIEHNDRTAIPFILDLRPVLLTISWAIAPEGRVDVAAICERQAVRCPTGFCLRLTGGHAVGDRGNHFRSVFPGQVLVVEFVPRRPGGFRRDTDDGRPPGDDVDRLSDQDDGLFPPGVPPEVPGLDAGTGSTQRAFSGPSAPGSCGESDGRVVMWGLGLVLGAFLDGNQHSTPVLLSAIAPLLRFKASGGCLLNEWAPLSLLLRLWAAAALGFGMTHRGLALLVSAGLCVAALGACSRSAEGIGSSRNALLFLCILCALAVQPAEGVQIFDLTRSPDRDHPIGNIGGVRDCSCPVQPSSVAPVIPFPSRPVPTPCRGRLESRPAVATHASADVLAGTVPVFCPSMDASVFSLAVDLGPLVTLLEDSAQRDHHWAFLAATLLDTLCEHFDGAAVPLDRVPRQALASPTILSLATALPVRSGPATVSAGCEVFELDSRQCQLPCCISDVQRLFSSVPFAALRAAPTGLPRPDRFACWLASGSPGRSPAPDEILVLTSDGSFSADDRKSGWAVAVSLVSGTDRSLPGQFIGCFGGDMMSFAPFCPSDTRLLDAYLAEVAGLLWAGVAAAQLPWHGDVLFRADNVSALAGVHGEVNMIPHLICTLARSVHTALQVGAHCRPSYQHVPGHAGDAANELADAAASLAACARFSPAPFSFDLGLWGSNEGSRALWLPHLCLSLARPDEVPALHRDVHSWARGAGVCNETPTFAMAPFLRDAADAGETGQARGVCLRLATYNVLSLLGEAPPHRPSIEGLHGATGRVSLLARGLDEAGVQIAGLQECRTPQGTLRGGPYRRLSSGGDAQSCFGVELWLHQRAPIDAESAVVLHADPTCLIASASLGEIPLRILVAHSPHRVHPDDVKRAWWTRVHELCRVFSGASPWLLLLDANARVGSDNSQSVGPWQADTQDLNGDLFHQLLVYLGSWLPATFQSCSVGDGNTLYQKRNGSLARSDYVGIPLAWANGVCEAWVDPSISAGHPCVDHFAAVLSVRLALPVARRARGKAPRISASALADPSNQAQILGIIRAAPRPAWDIDSSEHAALVVDYLYRRLVACFPAAQRKLRASYLSAHAATLHHAVSALRHRVRSLKLALRLASLRCVFVAWRGRQAYLDVYKGSWLWQVKEHLGLSCLLLGRFGRQLRRQCRSDRASYFESLATDLAGASAQELHTQVRRVLKPRRYRRAGIDPLPLLQRADGTTCASFADSVTTWREHFAALEDGVVVPTDDFVQTCRQRQQAFDGTDVVDVDTVPCFRHFEHALRASAPGKAAGPDLIPPVLLRGFSHDLADLLWPLMLKVIFRVIEASLCKVDSRRPCIAPLVTWSWGIGCLTHSRVRSEVQGCSGAILFLDLASAYYGVVRETVLGSGLSDRPVEDIAASLGLNSDDLQLLRHHVATEPIFQTQQASPILEELAREMHSSTWFMLARDNSLVHTHRGTRPGGALADIVFNVLFGKVLCRRDADALRESVPMFPWDGVRAPFASHGPQSSEKGTPQPLGDVVYADDLATFVLCGSAGEMRSALSGVAAATLDVLGPHGLRPNYGPKKTAALVAMHGPGSRAARSALFGSMGCKLPVLLEHSGMIKLDLVACYRHLGSHLSYDGSLTTEIKYRLALGRAAFKEGRQRLFACRQVSLERRAFLFKTYVLSVVMSGVGTWPWLTGSEWQLFSGGIIGLYRQLLCLRSSGGYAVTTSQILARSGLPSPASLLAAARLRFLGQLVRHGSDVAWAVLRWYTPFQRAVLHSCQWLLQAVRSTSSLTDPEVNWETWRQVICDSPGHWKGLLKRAEAWHCEVISFTASCDSFVRKVWSPCSPSATAAVFASCAHACLRCGIAFRTQQAWGAHAHRAHGYLSPAHRLAVGRRCVACGLIVANQTRLRKHFKTSPACLLVAQSASGTFAVDLSEGQVQCPAVAGVPKASLPPPAPVLCPELLHDLRSLTDCNDQTVYDIVCKHIEPLPVLRRTLEAWVHSVVVEALRIAGSDVLLILHAEHLCSQVSGLEELMPSVLGSFCPLICPVPTALPLRVAPVRWIGALCHTWVSRLGLDSRPTAPLVWPLRGPTLAFPVAAFCCCPPSPPFSLSHVVDHSSCSLRHLRANSRWFHDVLVLLELLMTAVRDGIPVMLRFACTPQALGPVAEWLSLQAASEGPDFHNCFTLEFA